MPVSRPLNNDPVILGQDSFVSSATQIHDPGQIATDGRGNYFRYVKAGGTTLVAGNVIQASAQNRNHQTMAVQAAAASIEAYRERGLDVIPSRGALAANTVAGTVSGWERAYQWSCEQGGGRRPPQVAGVDIAVHPYLVSPGHQLAGQSG